MRTSLLFTIFFLMAMSSIGQIQNSNSLESELDSLFFYGTNQDIKQHLHSIEENIKVGEEPILDIYMVKYYASIPNDSLTNFYYQKVNNYFQSLDDSISVLFARNLLAKANTITDNERFEEAIELSKRSNEIIDAQIGKNNLNYATNLYFQSARFKALGDFENALPPIQEAVKIVSSIYGEDHPAYAKYINMQAFVYYEFGENEKAKELYLEGLKINEKTLGELHDKYSSNLINLSSVYVREGDFKKGEEVLKKSLSIIESLNGKENLPYAGALNNLGSLYLTTHNYIGAEDCLLGAMNIRKSILGTQNLNYSISLTNLGSMYSQIGDYEKSVEVLLEALEILKEVNKKEDIRYASTVNNLAGAYYAMEDYEKALKTYKESTRVVGDLFGDKHQYYSICLNNIGNVYKGLKDYENAEDYYLKCLGLKEELYGKDHPSYNKTLQSLAGIYSSWGEFEKSESMYLEALDNNLKVYGEKHLSSSIVFINLAVLYGKKGQYEEAENYHIRYLSNRKNALLNAFRFLSEKEKIKYHGRKMSSLEYAKRFTLEHQTDRIEEEVFNSLLFEKGLHLDASIQTKSFIYSNVDSEIESKYNQLLELRKEVKNINQQPISKQEDTAVLEEEIKQLEKFLARKSSFFRSEQAMSAANAQQIADKLTKDEVCIEFTNFNASKDKNVDSIIYVAFILNSNNEISTKYLCTEKELKSKLGNKKFKAEFINQLYGNESRGVINEDSKRSLYDMIWNPIDSQLTGVTKIYYAPSGLLNKLNINAIAIDEEQVLSDKYQMNCMLSTRNVILPSQETSNNDAYVLGGVEYNLSEGTKDQNPSDLDQADRSNSNLSWNFLKWTVNESSFIHEKLVESGFNSTFRKGFDATEEDFKNLSNEESPKIIHFATHGYFYSNQADAKHSGPVNYFQSSDNPLLRSGLILSEANFVWGGNDPIEGKEDGILTASEISNMNLMNTELVVLSACETGLGDIEGAEGVYGLQRAFKMAGSKYLIMSLWQVPDRTTSVFMQRFYENLLDENMEVRSAFNKTQLEMRDRFFDHYQWAGFVLIE